MPARTTSRLDRLERLEGLLKAGDVSTGGELARSLGISLRSLSRDVALLRGRGVPIDGDRGRGGGLRLDRRWSIGRLSLDEEEALDLLISLAVAEQMGSPLLLGHLAGVRQKLVAAFSERRQAAIRALRNRILVGMPASQRVVLTYRRPSPADLAAVKTAFFTMRRLRIRYVNEDNRETEREIEPQFLYLNIPIWYLLAWDHLRADVRFFRADRVRRAELLPGSFRLRDRRTFLAKAEGMARAL